MSKTALLVIDVQYGIFMRKEYDGMAVYMENELLLNIKSLISRARAEGAPVIYIMHIYENFPLMEKGSPLWEAHPDIKPMQDDIIIEKHHADAFYSSELECTLKRLGVTNLVITGLQTAYCVDTTCRRAHSMGYNCILAGDGHSTLDSDILPAEKIIAHHNSVLGSQFASVKRSADITFMQARHADGGRGV